MSDQIGNNPETGSANPTPEQVQQTAQKSSVRDAAAAQKKAGVLVTRLGKVAHTANDILTSLSTAIFDCQQPLLEGVVDSAAWQLTTNPEGKPWGSWQDFLSQVFAAEPLLAVFVQDTTPGGMRDQIVGKMLDAGMSYRAIEEATNKGVSKSSAGNVDKKRKANPGGDTKGVASTDAQKADKLVTTVMNALKKFRDGFDSLSPEQRGKVSLDIEQTVSALAAYEKTQVQIAAQKRAAETAGTPATPATPATPNTAANRRGSKSAA